MTKSVSRKYRAFSINANPIPAEMKYTIPLATFSGVFFPFLFSGNTEKCFKNSSSPARITMSRIVEKKKMRSWINSHTNIRFGLYSSIYLMPKRGMIPVAPKKNERKMSLCAVGEAALLLYQNQTQNTAGRNASMPAIHQTRKGFMPRKKCKNGTIEMQSTSGDTA